MEAERHTLLADGNRGAATRDRPHPARVADDALLDAARRCVLADGVRRTTLAGIARSAGVSRMTVYRRFPDVGSVLAALMTREFGALLRRVAAEVPAGVGTARARLVEHAVAGVCALAADPLLRTVLDLDSDLLLPYLTERFGATQLLAEEFLHALVADGHRDGSVRRGDAAVQARALLVLLQSFVLSRRPATTGIDDATLLTELRHLLEGALAP